MHVLECKHLHALHLSMCSLSVCVCPGGRLRGSGRFGRRLVSGGSDAARGNLLMGCAVFGWLCDCKGGDLPGTGCWQQYVRKLRWGR